MWRAVRLTQSMCRNIGWSELVAREDVALATERCAALYRKLIARGVAHHAPTHRAMNALVGLAVAGRSEVIAITVKQLHELCEVSIPDARKALATLEKSELIERLQYPEERR